MNWRLISRMLRYRGKGASYKAKKTGRCGTSALRQVVWEVGEAGPDGCEAVVEEVACLNAENGCPHGRH
jgi:hypothetical protein